VGQTNLDASINRQFPLGEHRYLEVRGEFFNVLNKTQFSSTSGLGANVSTPSTFGIYTAAQDPRITQIAAKFVF
jgi:hypothetical protein